MIYRNILEAVGHTPTVRLQRITVGNGAEIFVKLESFNPGGSIKDRAAFFIIDQAEKSGRLTPGQTIIESTSGNFGKSLALIGAVRGYRVILVVDPKVPRSTVAFASALGADIETVDVPDEHGSYQQPRMARVRQLLAQIPGSFWPDQYDNPDNPRVHAEITAHEILASVGVLDALVATVSTGGHISGVSSTLRERLPDLTVIGVDAIGSAIFGFPSAPYVMRGVGLAWPPGNLRRSLVDRVHLVADYEGVATCRMLARYEGLLVGESAGAAVFAAVHHAHHHPGRIVVVAADGGTNYLDETFDDGWLAETGLAAEIANAELFDVEHLVAAALRPNWPSRNLMPPDLESVDLERDIMRSGDGH